MEDIKNFLQVSECIASSGQPEEHQFKVIAQAGYTLVINLAMPNSENAIPEEGHIVTSRGMSYVHIPVPFDAPSTSQLRAFIRIMKAYRGEKTWVHCVLNYRVSAFLYQYYRLALHAPPEEARKVMLASWQPNATWQQVMQLSREEVAF